ncbi:hypothetical protein PPTG_22096 [Phytophthora nicotianae INRA-310]|uniref:Uncharacterized protein n=1 Tax=Phytophthora nicotianae (strain INRA-310) TaxID=761204 RepID=W2QSI4_PHYN3|nr:hypothetical protein PPTG_22096 [Phytophthora nicotianae INRA-310]ETN15230.1 hypothetical protein PPTG_22096 [Phytophthora nicotianae INRA-310]
MSRREPRPRGALNHTLHRAYDALLPHRRHDPARLEESRPVNTDRSTGQPPPVASLQPPSGTSPMDPEPARTALLPYVTLIARHQVQLSVSPPLQRDIRTQRRLNDALGFDQVLAAVQPLSDTLPDLPHAVGELTAQLKISREEAATAKHLLVPVQLRVESLETLLNKSTAELNGLQAEIKRLKSANVHIGSLLEKSKESRDVQTENRRLAMNYAEQKQDIIDALDKQIEKEREVFKTTVSANTENTRKLHDLLLKATQALAKTAQQVQSSASKRIRHGSDDGSSDDSSEEKTPVPSGRASRAGSAADAGEGSAAAASSPTLSRRGLHMPKAWKNKPKSKRQKTASRSPASVRSRSSYASRRSTSRPPACPPSVAMPNRP